jgi:aldehyde:ferredoxin oxidoreductase
LFGYAGRVLHVDLTTGKTNVEPLNEEYAKKYIGGIGPGIRMLHDYSAVEKPITIVFVWLG